MSGSAYGAGYKERLRRDFSSAAETYDGAAALHGRVADRLAAALAPEAPARPECLDVGCGTGVLSQRLLALRPGRLVALDLSPAMSRKAAEKLAASAGARAPVEALVGDAEALPLPAGRFDLVASSYALHWVRPVERALAECLRVLRPGGLLALAVPVEGSLPELADALRAAGLDAAERYPFPPAARMEDFVAGHGLATLHRATAEDRLSAPSARELFRALRRLGVRNAGRGVPQMTPSAVRRLLEAYDQRATGAAVTASFRTWIWVGRLPGVPGKETA
jgi:malonyl-CoA O-methyltransferase